MYIRDVGGKAPYTSSSLPEFRDLVIIRVFIKPTILTFKAPEVLLLNAAFVETDITTLNYCSMFGRIYKIAYMLFTVIFNNFMYRLWRIFLVNVLFYSWVCTLSVQFRFVLTTTIPLFYTNKM